MSVPEAIRLARERIADALQLTPLVPAPLLSRELSADVRVKCESLQVTGSFKARGALNKMLQMSDADRERGVICASAGNHAQALAWAAARTGAPAVIVMPEATPLVKVSETRRWGPEVILHGSGFDDAVDHARRLQQERGLTFVHAFDDEQVLTGQGTCGMEIVEQFPEIDTVVVPIGGGGLISGIARAIKGAKPAARVYGVQTEAAPAVQQSFRSAETIDVKAGPSIAEGIAVKKPGAVTMPIVRELVDDVVLVPESCIEDAIFKLLETQKLLAEGAGAAAFAALLTHRLPDLGGHRVAVVLSGGNIDLNILSRIVERALVRQHRFTRLGFTISDRPGGLAAALAIVAGCGANVLHITHNRFFTDASFWETEIELTLETRDEEMVEGLIASLRQAGYVNVMQPDAALAAVAAASG
jgi:threonine dehydratase